MKPDDYRKLQVLLLAIISVYAIVQWVVVVSGSYASGDTTIVSSIISLASTVVALVFIGYCLRESNTSRMKQYFLVVGVFVVLGGTSEYWKELVVPDSYTHLFSPVFYSVFLMALIGLHFRSNSRNTGANET